jgi:hypothetical protein
MEYLIYTILIIIIILAGFVIRNMLVKVEVLEDIVLSNDKYITSISDIIEKSDAKLKEIDEREIFSADDELGFFIKELKTLQEEINGYIRK